MFFPDEVREPPAVKTGNVRTSDRELKMAQQLIDGLSTEWNPSRYKDTYREEVLSLIRKKAKGKEIEAPEEAKPGVPADLTEALKRSFEHVKSKQRGRRTQRRKSA